MFVGHALLAFAVAALAAERRGWDGRRTLTLGAVAGAFATIPDVDVAYALVGLLEWRVADGALGASTAFWDASRVVHRSVTHSLVVGAIAAPAFGLVAVRGAGRATLARGVAGGLLLSLVGIAFAVDGPLAAFVTGLFVASGILVAATARRTSLSPTTVGLAALWGLWSHPWGDLVTGSPPEWLYPFASPVLSSRVVLHADPTLHLLGAFAIELAVIWFALATCCRLTGRSPVALVDRRAAVGGAYGIAALAATPPTLAVSYHFVFSILGVGLLCGAIRTPPSPTLPRSLGRDRRSPVPVSVPSVDSLLDVSLTGLAAVTIALVAYALVYLTAVAPA
ncbi:metal-dependent hydrolase [Natrinema salifodinae]|uniref:LexA-binding, inner membrane-associated putative hydrolase n=1 Tax=Natrinema salifodinae TaxID=1202768 RepID=A0A1I0QXC2_9EURY|nr:metal-dependent hydrolase [Natrinema salifodinae]SEW32174.1 LexA-binding, inner membrane-associated putative hydrolase [Natrinema salifodinae]